MGNAKSRVVSKFSDRSATKQRNDVADLAGSQEFLSRGWNLPERSFSADDILSLSGAGERSSFRQRPLPPLPKVLGSSNNNKVTKDKKKYLNFKLRKRHEHGKHNKDTYFPQEQRSFSSTWFSDNDLNHNAHFSSDDLSHISSENRAKFTNFSTGDLAPFSSEIQTQTALFSREDLIKFFTTVLNDSNHISTDDLASYTSDIAAHTTHFSNGELVDFFTEVLADKKHFSSEDLTRTSSDVLSNFVSEASTLSSANCKKTKKKSVTSRMKRFYPIAKFSSFLKRKGVFPSKINKNQKFTDYRMDNGGSKEPTGLKQEPTRRQEESGCHINEASRGISNGTNSERDSYLPNLEVNETSPSKKFPKEERQIEKKYLEILDISSKLSQTSKFKTSEVIPKNNYADKSFFQLSSKSIQNEEGAIQQKQRNAMAVSENISRSSNMQKKYQRAITKQDDSSPEIILPETFSVKPDIETKDKQNLSLTQDELPSPKVAIFKNFFASKNDHYDGIKQNTLNQQAKHGESISLLPVSAQKELEIRSGHMNNNAHCKVMKSVIVNDNVSPPNVLPRKKIPKNSNVLGYYLKQRAPDVPQHLESKSLNRTETRVIENTIESGILTTPILKVNPATKLTENSDVSNNILKSNQPIVSKVKPQNIVSKPVGVQIVGNDKPVINPAITSTTSTNSIQKFIQETKLFETPYAGDCTPKQSQVVPQKVVAQTVSSKHIKKDIPKTEGLVIEPAKQSGDSTSTIQKAFPETNVLKNLGVSDYTVKPSQVIPQNVVVQNALNEHIPYQTGKTPDGSNSLSQKAILGSKELENPDTVNYTLQVTKVVPQKVVAQNTSSGQIKNQNTRTERQLTDPEITSVTSSNFNQQVSLKRKLLEFTDNKPISNEIVPKKADVQEIFFESVENQILTPPKASNDQKSSIQQAILGFLGWKNSESPDAPKLHQESSAEGFLPQNTTSILDQFTRKETPVMDKLAKTSITPISTSFNQKVNLETKIPKPKPKEISPEKAEVQDKYSESVEEQIFRTERPIIEPSTASYASISLTQNVILRFLDLNFMKSPDDQEEIPKSNRETSEIMVQKNALSELDQFTSKETPVIIEPAISSDTSLSSIHKVILGENVLKNSTIGDNYTIKPNDVTAQKVSIQKFFKDQIIDNESSKSLNVPENKTKPNQTIIPQLIAKSISSELIENQPIRTDKLKINPKKTLDTSASSVQKAIPGTNFLENPDVPENKAKPKQIIIPKIIPTNVSPDFSENQPIRTDKSIINKKKTLDISASVIQRVIPGTKRLENPDVPENKKTNQTIIPKGIAKSVSSELVENQPTRIDKLITNPKKPLDTLASSTPENKTKPNQTIIPKVIAKNISSELIENQPIRAEKPIISHKPKLDIPASSIQKVILGTKFLENPDVPKNKTKPNQTIIPRVTAKSVSSELVENNPIRIDKLIINQKKLLGTSSSSVPKVIPRTKFLENPDVPENKTKPNQTIIPKVIAKSISSERIENQPIRAENPIINHKQQLDTSASSIQKVIPGTKLSENPIVPEAKTKPSQTIISKVIAKSVSSELIESQPIRTDKPKINPKKTLDTSAGSVQKAIPGTKFLENLDVPENKTKSNQTVIQKVTAKSVSFELVKNRPIIAEKPITNQKLLLGTAASSIQKVIPGTKLLENPEVPKNKTKPNQTIVSKVIAKSTSSELTENQHIRADQPIINDKQPLGTSAGSIQKVISGTNFLENPDVLENKSKPNQTIIPKVIVSNVSSELVENQPIRTHKPKINRKKPLDTSASSVQKVIPGTNVAENLVVPENKIKPNQTIIQKVIDKDISSELVENKPIIINKPIINRKNTLDTSASSVQDVIPGTNVLENPVVPENKSKPNQTIIPKLIAKSVSSELVEYQPTKTEKPIINPKNLASSIQKVIHGTKLLENPDVTENKTKGDSLEVDVGISGLLVNEQTYQIKQTSKMLPGRVTTHLNELPQKSFAEIVISNINKTPDRVIKPTNKMTHLNANKRPNITYPQASNSAHDVNAYITNISTAINNTSKSSAGNGSTSSFSSIIKGKTNVSKSSSELHNKAFKEAPIKISAIECAFTANEYFIESQDDAQKPKNYIVPNLLKTRRKVKVNWYSTKVCPQYNSLAGCSLYWCFRFHVCYHWIRNNCTRENCQRYHSFQSYRNEDNLGLRRLYSLPNETLVEYLNKSTFHWRQTRSVLDSPHICISNLKRRCDSQQCKDFHMDAAYSWLVLINGKWVQFSSQISDEIESSYCIPNRDLVTFFVGNGEEFPESLPVKQRRDKGFFIDLLIFKMATSNNVTYKVKRLSTVSDVASNDTLATRWLWFWEDDNGICNLYRNGMLREFFIVSVSDYMELQFLKGEKTILISLDFKDHILDLDNFLDTEIDSKTVRNIRRRPVKVKKTHLEVLSFVNLGELPPSAPRLSRKVVPNDSMEFLFFRNMIIKSLPLIKEVILERIENKYLWEAYQLRKNQMLTKYGNDKAILNEQYLFHGTMSSVVDKICSDNFDWRLHGDRVGHLFGCGAYFANSAYISDKYSSTDHSGFNCMFIALVLVGRAVKGNRETKLPPLDPITNIRLDSTVNKDYNPDIFVKFNQDEYYPAYFVRYK